MRVTYTNDNHPLSGRFVN